MVCQNAERRRGSENRAKRRDYGIVHTIRPDRHASPDGRDPSVAPAATIARDRGVEERADGR